MKSIFISGIPAAGKTYLAKKLHYTTGLPVLSTDVLREKMNSNSSLQKWVQFFWNKNENEYLENITCIKHCENLKKQSEAFWPEILKEIKKILENGPFIVEGVNLLPHLVKRDLGFHGVILLGEYEEQIFNRLHEEPRWGSTTALQKEEANLFYNCEGTFYKYEAEKYGYSTFSKTEEAYNYLLDVVQSPV